MIGGSLIYFRRLIHKRDRIMINLSTYNRVLRTEIYDKNQQRCEVKNDKKL